DLHELIFVDARQRHPALVTLPEDVGHAVAATVGEQEGVQSQARVDLETRSFQRDLSFAVQRIDRQELVVNGDFVVVLLKRAINLTEIEPRLFVAGLEFEQGLVGGYGAITAKILVALGRAFEKSSALLVASPLVIGEDAL